MMVISMLEQSRGDLGHACSGEKTAGIGAGFSPANVRVSALHAPELWALRRMGGYQGLWSCALRVLRRKARKLLGERGFAVCLQASPKVVSHFKKERKPRLVLEIRSLALSLASVCHLIPNFESPLIVNLTVLTRSLPSF